MKANKLLTIFVAILFLIIFGSIGDQIFRGSSQSSLPVYGEIAPFRLLDAQGQVFDSARLDDKVWVTAFFFTTCSGICPIMTKNLRSLHDMYRSYPDVEFVSISVNPEQDTPQVLADYARKYGADTGRWYFLTGSREDITRIAVHGFKVGSIDQPVFHSAYFILVDGRGRIRGYYEGTQKEEVERLSKDLIRLYNTKRHW